MMDFKVEWVSRFAIHDTKDEENRLSMDIPVVRLAEVETLITEMEWAMELISETYLSKDGVERARACLASIAAWRKGQEGKSCE